ncbi:MAG: hypothetical protein OER88_13860 [Planctomycetota bacterium]|nr:hypothetical protein [Planctomycetota bacterium]
MRPALLLVFLAACSSTASQREASAPQTKTTQEAELRVARVGVNGSDIALELSGAAPGRLGRDMKNGNRWLLLDEPRGFSFAGREILAGTTAWQPTSTKVTFVQSRSGGASAAATLVRIEGLTTTSAEEIEKPALETQGLSGIENDLLRSLLGRGIDRVVGRGRAETIEWIDVVGADGAPAEWREPLREAHRSGSLAALQGLDVLLKRIRIGSRKYYKATLASVVIAGQSTLTPDRNGRRYVWEGVWNGRTGKAADGHEYPDWNTQPVVTYREYTQVRTSPGVLRTLFAPVTLTADFGAALFDPNASDGLFEETKKRRDERR